VRKDLRFIAIAPWRGVRSQHTSGDYPHLLLISDLGDLPILTPEFVLDAIWVVFVVYDRILRL
jgi:hypothetical protein